jgi:hypothetical protein
MNRAEDYGLNRFKGRVKEGGEKRACRALAKGILNLVSWICHARSFRPGV